MSSCLYIMGEYTYIYIYEENDNRKFSNAVSNC